jgi:invasion protein IalB
MRNSLIAGAAAALVTLSTGVALAQTQPAPAQSTAPNAQQAPQLPAFDQPPWTKICSKQDSKELCRTVRDLLLPTTQWTMTAQISQDKGGKDTLTVIIPGGVVLPLGARVLIDGQTLDTAKDRICYGPSCVADMPLSDANLATIKKGKKLTVQALTFQGQPVALDMSLDGFGKALDGPGIDPQAYQAQVKSFNENLQKIFQPVIDAQRAQMQQQQQQQQGAPQAPAQ